MGKELSQQEIDDLEGREKAGKSSEPSPVIPYDFRHPARVSKYQVRTLENLHANMARMMASSFSAIMRAVVDVDIAFVDQTTYAEFVTSLHYPSCSYTFTVEPLGGPAVLDFALPVAYAFVDREFGGFGANPPQEARPLTAIQRQIMARVVTRALGDLEATWEPLLKVRIEDLQLETNPEFMQIVQPADTVILIAFEFNSQHCSGLVNLCYPYFTLEPVLPYLTVQTWAGRSLGRRHQNRQERLMRLKDVPAEVRIVWGRGQVPASDLSDIREGDILVLETRADGPSIVYLEDQPLFLARTGTDPAGRYAAEVVRALPPVDLYDPLYLEGRHNV